MSIEARQQGITHNVELDAGRSGGLRWAACDERVLPAVFYS